MEMTDNDFDSSKPRYSRITDVLDLIILMQSKTLGVTLSDIQKELNISRRTAERLRDAISNVLPINEIETADREKHWGFERSYLSEIISFSPEEIATVEAIKERLKFENEKESLGKIITKLKAHEANKNKTQVSRIEDRIELLLKSEGSAVSQNPKHKIDVNIFDAIREAINTNKKIKANYNGKKKILAPYGIIYGTDIYLIGVENKHEKPYVYLLHKFKDINLTNETFDKGDFDIKSFASQSFGVYQNEIMKVELLFSKDVKDDVLNYNFHPTQKITENYDGTVTVKFKASGPLEIIWHLFRWGSSAKIVAPKDLKKLYIDYLQNCLDVQKG